MDLALKQDELPKPPDMGSAALPEMPPSAETSAFWDAPDAQTAAVSEVVHLEATQPTSSANGLLVAVAAGLILVAAGGMWYTISEEESPLGSLWASVSSILGFGEELPEAPATAVLPKQVPVPVTRATPVAPAPAPVASVPGNPYWLLPNQLAVPGPGRSWTASEEEAWRAGLMHRFTWQRYKTVLDVRRARLAGSEAILWDALEERKLWTRMQAVFGLADFGIPVSLEVVEKAVGNTRPETFTSYLQRFVPKSTESERYVLRHAVRVVDEAARGMILRILDRADDPMRDLYLAAASDDPGLLVQSTVAELTLNRPVQAEALDRYRALSSAPVAVQPPVEATVEDVPPPVDAPPELPAEVEFYNVDPNGEAIDTTQTGSPAVGGG